MEFLSLAKEIHRLWKEMLGDFKRLCSMLYTMSENEAKSITEKMNRRHFYADFDMDLPPEEELSGGMTVMRTAQKGHKLEASNLGIAPTFDIEAEFAAARLATWLFQVGYDTELGLQFVRKVLLIKQTRVDVSQGSIARDMLVRQAFEQLCAEDEGFSADLAQVLSESETWLTVYSQSLPPHLPLENSGDISALVSRD